MSLTPRETFARAREAGRQIHDAGYSIQFVDAAVGNETLMKRLAEHVVLVPRARTGAEQLELLENAAIWVRAHAQVSHP